MAIVIPNTFSANTLIKSAEVNTNFSTLGAASPWASNPISAAGDLIVGASAGVSTTLPAGAANQVLKVVNGVPTWATFTGGINYIAANPDFEADTAGWITYNDTQAVTITDASPAVFTSAAAHGYALGQPVAFITSGGLPAGLTAATRYYVSSVPSSTTYTVSATLGGADINTSSAGSGTHTQCPLTPITGNTGTAAGLALTRSTVAPLRGTASGLLTQTNATVVAGQGTSFAFTIDPADKAKVLQVSLDFNASVDFTPSSGQVGSHSDLEFFIKDVTNSVLIPVSSNLITANGANNFTYQGTFQSSSNSVSYILCIHAATANSPATGFKFKYDNIVVGPQHTVEGAAITDWVDYDLVIGATTTAPTIGTTTTNRAQFRQVGDSMEVRYDLSQTSGGSGGSGTYLFSLPTGRLIDASKVTIYAGTTVDNQVGSFEGYAQSTLLFGVVSPYDTSNVAVTFTYLGGPAGGTPLSSTAGFIDSGAVQYSIHFTVPIAGWASNVQLSQDTDTRVVAAAYKTAAGQSITNNVITIVDFDTREYDTHASTTTGASWKHVVSVSGKYEIFGTVAFSGDATGNRDIFLYKNGVSAKVFTFAPSTTIISSPVQATLDLVAGDYIDIRVRQSTAGALTLYNSADYNYFYINRLSGPATIAASETIGFSALGASPTCADTTTGTDILIFPSLGVFGFDTHSGYSTVTGEYTVQQAGLYRVGASYEVNQTGGLDFVGAILLTKNGTVFAKGSIHHESGSAVVVAPSISKLVRCLPGDRLAPVPLTTTTGTISADATINFFEVEKVGSY